MGIGFNNSIFNVSEVVKVGGSELIFAPGIYESAKLRISNGSAASGSSSNFAKGLWIGAGGQVYTSDMDGGAAGDSALLQVGLEDDGTGNRQAGDVVLHGSDTFDVESIESLLMRNVNENLAILESSAYAPLLISDASNTTGSNGLSKIILTGTGNNIRGIIETNGGRSYTNTKGDLVDYDRMDMVVNMRGDANGLFKGIINADVGNTVLGEYFVNYLGWTDDQVATVNETIQACSLAALGGKFTGVGLIGTIASGDYTEINIQDYRQYQGVVIGSGALSAASGGLIHDPSVLNIYGKTTVNGGIMAVDANVNGDMEFAGLSHNAADRAVLGGLSQTIVNDSLFMSGAFKNLTAAIKTNGAIDLSLFGINFVDMNVNVENQGEIVFGIDLPAAIFDDMPAANRMTVGIEDAASVNVVATDSASIKFNELFLKTDWAGASDPIILIDSQGNANVNLDVAKVDFDGLFGHFVAQVQTDGGAQYYALTTADNTTGVTFDGTREDFNRASSKLNSMYGGRTNGGINNMIYRSYSNSLGLGTANPYDRLQLANGATSETAAGRALIDSFNMNMGNLQAFAQGRSEANNILNLYNGNAMNGVNMVSQAVARSHVRTSMNRSDDIRGMWDMVKNTVLGGDGLASGIMNSCYTNRVWVGGFGLWEDTDSRHGMAGYKYKSGGFIVGYDRLVGQNWIVGGSFAYNKGAFEDKAALSHDSDIDNYSLNLYATYNHSSGFFGTAFSGYTYSDNDINETYRTNLNQYAKSNHDNHTNT